MKYVVCGNVHCGKKITPLETVLGARCPHCGSDVRPEKLRITPENDAQFRLSEALYYAYLEWAKGISKSGTKMTAEDVRGKEQLAEAMETCRRAAYDGHPEAILRLAFYYDNNYVDYGQTDDRDRIAVSLYHRILDEDGLEGVYKAAYKAHFEKSADGGKVAEQIKERAERLRRRAARCLLNTLCSVSDALSRETAYDYGRAWKEYAASDDALRAEFPETEKRHGGTSGYAEFILSLFGEELGRTRRAPVFGYYCMTTADAAELGARLEASAGKVWKRGLDMYCWRAEEDGGDIVINESDDGGYGRLVYGGKPLTEEARALQDAADKAQTAGKRPSAGKRPVPEKKQLFVVAFRMADDKTLGGLADIAVNASVLGRLISEGGPRARTLYADDFTFIRKFGKKAEEETMGEGEGKFVAAFRRAFRREE